MPVSGDLKSGMPAAVLTPGIVPILSVSQRLT